MSPLQVVGLAIDDEELDERQLERFSARLEDSLAALQEVLERPGFGLGAPSVGVELEMFVMGQRAEPLPLAPQLLTQSDARGFTLELDRFDLEYNSQPAPLAGRPFSMLGEELRAALTRVRKRAATHRARIATVGILPTLQRQHLGRDAINDAPRYRALADRLRERKQEPFHVHIDGADPLELDWEHVAFEGANASFQIHVRVEPERFTALYNAIQLVTPVVLSVAGNSPTFLGHRLWHETRIALFKQSVDDRPRSLRCARQPRVCFGEDWLRGGAHALFAAGVHGYEPLLAQIDDEDPREVVARGGLPGLRELRLHASTVWHWNRPVYDPSGHLRIELRALPSGPTVTDMMANMAFALGLAHAYAQPGAWGSMPFAAVHHNFYRAAQHGPGATLMWPGQHGELEPRHAQELVSQLCPQATQGLIEQDVHPDEARLWVDIVRERALSGRTGAVWQRNALEVEAQRHGPHDAVRAMTEQYAARSEDDRPVHTWSPVS